MTGQDIISINDIEIFAYHGVLPEENIVGQKFCISAFLYLDVTKAAAEDDIGMAVDYSAVTKDIKEYTVKNTFKLIESLACNLADMLLLKYDLVKKVCIEVKKPWAPVHVHLDTVAIKVEREWHDVYLGIGSNMGEREEYLDNAVSTLDETTGIILDKVSEYIVTAPVGNVSQDDFLNAAVSIRTIFSPKELLNIIHDIENENGRERIEHWGPRTLDIDILLYDNLIMGEENLIIPHVEMINREFVLKPLAQIAPYVIHPVYHKSVAKLLSEYYENNGIVNVEDDFGFEAIDGLTVNATTKVAYFGVEGTYSQQAMELFFGETGYESYSLSKFNKIMEAVENGDADYGVIPIENSSTGGINDLYDHINDYDVYIVGEQIVKIEHALLGLPESTFSDIKYVYSHPQGISQCGSFFEENPHIKPAPISSTAEGARLVVSKNDLSYASIASKRAAEVYGLKVLRNNVNELSNNRTRFVIISGNREYVRNAKKISLSFETKHESGALYRILSHFYHNNLNLEKIESRPIPERNWDYRFFIDIAGNLNMQGVKNALSAIGKDANNVNILGNY